MATQSDERLVALVRAGHEPAFEALVHRYRRPLLRYCRRLCPSEARAEEVLQQALMNAWVALRRDCEVRDVRAWLYRVAHNAALNAMRTERAMVAAPISIEGIHGGEQAAAVPAAGAPSLDQVLELRDALTGVAELPQMQREVIVRTAVGGHSHAEIASALGITAAAVRGLLYRARATLRDGVTALTPAPVLAWAAGAGGTRSPSERVAELMAGGSAPLAGLAVKSAAAAITAGVAITGSMIARDVAASNAHRHLWTAGSDAGLASTVGSGARDPSALLSAAVTRSQASVVDGAAGENGKDRLAGRTVAKPPATSSPTTVNVRSTQRGFQPVSTTLPGSQAGESRSHGEPAAEGAQQRDEPAGIQVTAGGVTAGGMTAGGMTTGGSDSSAPPQGGHGEGGGSGRTHGDGSGQGSHEDESQQTGRRESQHGPGYGAGHEPGDGRESREESGRASEHGAGQGQQVGGGSSREAPPHDRGQELGEHGGKEPKGGGSEHLDGGEPQAP